MAVLTKVQQVENYVRNRIQRGLWSPGQKLPEPIKISARLGVSETTVKLTLARLASEGVVERKQKLGTFVAEAEQTGTIVVLAREQRILSTTGHFYKSLLNEARTYLEGHGYKVVLVLGHGDTPEKFYDSIHLTEKPFCNRVVGILSLIELCELQSRIDQAGMHSVSIVPGGLVGTTDHYSVITDYRQLLQIGVDELKHRGYDDFALMYGMPMESEEGVLFNRKMDELRREAVDYDESRLISVPFSWDHRNVCQVFKDYWKGTRRSRAIFFLDDALFDVASRAFPELGIHIPDDLAIITHANTDSFFHTSVEMTRIEFDPRSIVISACEILNDSIEGKEIETPHKYISPKLVAGASL